LRGISFFKKFKIKKKIFKKNTFLLKNIKFDKRFNVLLNFFFILKKINNGGNFLKKNEIKNNFIICFSQKTCNTKSTIFEKKNLNTFSIGSIINYFKIKQGKYVRRSLKGGKILINFLKNLLLKKYFLQKNKKNFFLKLSGLDYNLLYFKKFYKNFIKIANYNTAFFLINLKINFNKKKDKKVKAIKKRLKKKILINFVKNVK
jgi:hypothetical protein